MTTVQNYVGGQWIEPENHGYLEVENPATTETVGRVPLSTAGAAGLAVESAVQAFPEWSRTPASRRVLPIFQLTDLMREHEEEISCILTREMGKSLPDSRHYKQSQHKTTSGPKGIEYTFQKLAWLCRL